MVRARGDIKLFPSECGPWRVRLLSKVVQIVGLVGFYSDVVVEKWSSKDEIWKPVNMLRKAVKKTAKGNTFASDVLALRHQTYIFINLRIFAILAVLLHPRSGNSGASIAENMTWTSTTRDKNGGVQCVQN